MERRIGILNYGLGNLSSISQALTSLGIVHEICTSPDALTRMSHIILPGVGSFKEGTDGLKRTGFIEPLREAVISEKKPLLGICLGMQLLADMGFEHGEHPGLSFLSGRVERIPAEAHTLPLPHIGWNSVHFAEGKRIVQGLKQDTDFYFVHSYHFIPKDEEVIAGSTDYGIQIAAIVEKGNIFGTQFHPEKSGEEGLKLLKNFAEIV